MQNLTKTLRKFSVVDYAGTAILLAIIVSIIVLFAFHGNGNFIASPSF